MTAGIGNVTAGITATGSASGTVSAGMVRSVVEFAITRGADRPALLGAARLAPGVMADDDARIAWADYIALYEAAAELCGDPAFALHLGEWVDGMDLLVCHVGSAAATMGGAIESINRYNRLAIDLETTGGGDPFQLEPTTEGTWLIDASIYPAAAPQQAETGFARLISGTRQLTERQFVRAVHLMRAEPPFRGEYERVFGAPVSFGERRNALLMDPDWLSVPLPATSRYADGVLEAHAARLLAAVDPRLRCRRAVAEVVAGRLGSRPVTMAAAARDLGMSRPTLYRALRREGTSFERVVQEVRQELANQLLGEGRSIAETADRLGFSEPSAFSRAYKRWTGASPRARR